MKITLDEPIEGYEEKAEIRPAKEGEKFIGTGIGINICTASCDHHRSINSVILTPKRQRAEVRRYWATVKDTGKRHQFSSRTCIWFYIETNSWHVNDLTDITPIDPEFLDAPPAKDWWTGAEKMPDKGKPIHFWEEEKGDWYPTDMALIDADTIWRYQPTAPTSEKGGG